MVEFGTGARSPEEEQAMLAFEAPNNATPAATENLTPTATGNENVVTPEVPAPLAQQETAYLAEHKTKAEAEKRTADAEHNYPLEARYNDERTNVANVSAEIAQFTGEKGFQSEITPEMAEATFNPETSAQILKQAERQTGLLFNNPEKQKAVLEEVTTYLDLVQKAQAEQDVPSALNMADVAKIVETNISALAFQDRVASENMLGDHGVRHIVTHNITVTNQLFDELERNGQEVKAIDRLLAHQVMIDHDLGYAMAPVRDAINREGPRGQDVGHNVLAAKFIRQRGEDQSDPINRLFSYDQLATIHEGIIHHDSSEVSLHLRDSSVQARQENLDSIIHLADNTDAFEDKLPELIYSMPESLRSMRLLKTAGEIGDNDLVGKIKEKLIQEVESYTGWAEDDKGAILKAVNTLTTDNYKFVVGRICGNNPEFSINEKGQVEISVQESAIHQEVIGLYGQKEYDQLKKFVADLTGLTKDQVDLDQEKIDTPSIVIKIAKGETNKSHELSDYQRRIEELIAEPGFSAFASADRDLSVGQKALETMAIHQEAMTENQPNATQEEKDRTQEQISRIKTNRREILEQYQNGGGI